jgi:hypothetical protein
MTLKRPKGKRHPLDFVGSQAAMWGLNERVFNVMSEPEYDATVDRHVVYGWPADNPYWDRASVASLRPVGPVARELLRGRR